MDADVDLTRQFSGQDYARALEAWAWLGVEGKTPVFTSPFGDVCLRDDAGFWWLDLLEGSFDLVWETADEMRAELSSKEGQEHYLLAELAWGAEQRGLVPTNEQVYGFTVPPVLGGAIDVENVDTISFVVGVNVAGQLHEQVRDLPPGTPISGITLTDS